MNTLRVRFFLLFVRYPQYRLQLEPKARFVAHLTIFDYVLCQLKKLGLDELWVSKIIFSHYFWPINTCICHYHEKLYLKLAMQKPFGVNLFTKLWITISLSQILLKKIHEYIKLVKLLVVQVIGLVEDEQCFYRFTFMKIKLQNWLACIWI
jgi:hypothetical protein